MTSFEQFRSFAATILLALYLPVPIYMTWIHAGRRLWKKIGRASFAIHLMLYAGLVAAIIWAHPIWCWEAWPWPAWISWIGLAPLAVAAWLAVRTYATIDLRTLLVFRQISSPRERRLLTDGILGTIRHPRYVMYTALAAGNLLITGYPLVLASLVVTLLFLTITIRMEEEELRECFGEEFEKYRRSVPAFFPRPTRR
jgi:protein-S-isoprenylcysteine O-methyltransferase Ste14